MKVLSSKQIEIRIHFNRILTFLIFLLLTSKIKGQVVSPNGGITPMAICPGSYLSPSELYPGASGGVYTVDLISDCPTYTVTESLTWVSYTKSGKRVTLTISANSGPERSGIVSIGQLPLNIYQSCGNYPGAAGTITGTNSVCPGQTGVNYYVAPITNATGYSWTLPSGASIASGSNTNSISVNYSTGASSGNINVRGTGCGTGSPSPNYYVTVNSISEPGSISGLSSVCRGSTHTYSISPVSDANYYVWTLPPGASGSSSSNSINVTFATEPGYIAVRAHNNAGCSSSTTSNILVGIGTLVQYNVSGGGTICQGTFSSVSLASSYSGKTYNLYRDGFIAGSQIGTGGVLTWGSLSSAGTYTVKGISDEGCEIPMLGSADINVLPSSTAASSINVSASPICPGSNSVLTVVGGSLGAAANWKWYTGGCGTNFVGTGSQITVSPASTTTYYVRAEGTCNITNCVSTNITITTPPVITQHPLSVTICDGAPTSFSISANGATSYQWQQYIGGSWSNISGETNTSYYISSTTGMEGRAFRCVVTGPCNLTTNSNSAGITFISLVQYTVSLIGDANVCPGNTSTVNLNGSTLDRAYNLYLNGELLSSEVQTGTGEALNWTVFAAGIYTVKGTSMEGCINQMAGNASLSIRTPSTPPSLVSATYPSICPGDYTTLFINGGSLEPGYGVWKWYSGFEPCGSIPEGEGATSIVVSPSATLTYYVRAEGGCVTTSCVPVTVEVKELPAILAQPINSSIHSDQNATFSISATGTDIEYQWQYSTDGNIWQDFDGPPASAWNTPDLIINNSEIFKQKLYRCRVSSDCDVVFSSSAKIIVIVKYLEGSEIPVITRQLNPSEVVGSTTINVSVNQTGASNISIPIFTPPGTNGMSPSISLFYNSQSGNDVLGYGWHLGGLSSITRTGRVLYYDNEIAPVTFTYSDKFILNGERLMLSDGTYGAAGSVYFSETNPFSKITAYETTGNGPTYFKQETKDGITYEYGNSADSRHFADNVSSTAYAWLISKAVDNNGNYIKYNYSNAEGEYWIRSIVYTGNTQQSLSPYDSLVFNYTIRTDDKTYYYAGSRYIHKTKLLQNITVYCEGNQVRKYEFGYTNGFYSQLVQITESDKDGNKYNPIIIDWGNEGTYHTTSEPYIDRFETDEGKMAGDFNGDGTDELAYWGGFQTGSYLNVYQVGRSNFHGIFDQTFDTAFFSPYPKQFSSCSNGDLNGDGIDDLIFTSTDSLFIYYGDQSEQQMFSRHSSQTYSGHLGYSTGDFNGDGIGELEAINNSKKLINFDGDSRTDKIVFSSTGYELITSTSSSGIITSSILNSNFVSKIFEGDFNGDSQSDLLVKTVNGWIIMDYNGSQYITNNSYTVPLSGSFDPTAAGSVLFIRDINFDGKSDIIAITGGNQHVWNCYFSKGLSFKSEQFIYNATKPPVYGDFVFGDFNGEGQLNCFYNLEALIELKRDDRSNLVQSVVNGLNHTYTFNYEFNVKPSGALSRPELNSLIYETYSGFVVNSLTHYGMDQVQKSIEYSYANPIIHLGGKGFLGFANQTITDNVTGFITNSKLNVDENSVYAYPAEQIVKDGLGGTISEKYFTGSKKTYSDGSYFGYISQVLSKDLIHNITDTTNYYYDLYGNDTLSIHKQNGELVTTTCTNYIQKGTWCPARVSSSTVTRSSYDNKPPYSTTAEYYYDNLGRITNSRVFAGLPDSLSKHFNYNLFGNIIATRTQTGNGIARYETYDYDTRQRFATTVSKGSLTSSYQYDPAFGLITHSTEPNGLETTITYNGFGRQTEQRISDNKYVTTEYTFDIDIPKIYKITQTNGITSTVSWYDDSGKQLRSSSEGFDGTVIYSDKMYSLKGELKNESRPYFGSSNPAWNVFTYDTLGRIHTSAVNGASINYAYNTNETTSTLLVTGANRVNTVLTNSLGQVSSVTRNNVDLGFQYDNKGKLVSVNPPVAGSNLAYGYDSRALLNQENDPDRGTSDYRFNSLGELVNYENANGDVDSIIYDSMGRDSIRIRNNTNTYYSYYTSGPGKGRLSQVYCQNRYKKFIYNIYGNVTRECDSISTTELFPYNYRYDDQGRLSWQMYPGGFAVTYSYNSKGFLEYIKRASDNSVIWRCNTVDAEGNITEYKLSGDNITVDKSYNGYGYLKQIKTTAGTVKQWLTYLFDEKTGDLKLRRDTLRSLAEEFGYDVYDQLKWSKVTSQDTLKMNYDVLGNITLKSNVGDYYYNDQKVHAVDSISESQDPNRQNIEYNNFNKPVFIANDNDSLVYQYNVVDDRIKGLLYYNSVLSKTIWYSGSYEKVLTGDSTTHYNYINGPDGPIAIARQSNSGTVIYYICKDHLGSITGIMNSSGALLEEYNYDPWGKRRNPDDWSYTSVATPSYTQHGFTGHEHLDMFGLINMNGRVYDSEIARFLNPDPIIQDPYNVLNYNRYSYCLNNPLRYSDPSGYSYKQTMDAWYGEGNYWYRGQAPGTWGGGGGSYGSGGGGYGGPGYGINGTGLNGIYYDWYSGTYRTTGEGNPGVSWGYACSIASQYGTSYKYGNIGGHVSSNGDAGYVRGLYSNERGTKPIVLDYDPGAQAAVDWYVSIGSWSLGIPQSSGANSLYAIGMGLNAAGFVSSAGEYSNVVFGSWKGANGKWYPTTWGGNQWTGARSNALSKAGAFRIASRGFFVVGTGISLYQGGDAFLKGNYAGATKSGLDIGMGAFATFGGPFGWIIGGGYFGLDALGVYTRPIITTPFVPPIYAVPDNTYVAPSVIRPWP